nr:MAG TPA: Galactose-1-phosphate uridyl transferase, N-terminal domain [Caudoviricetes sp.]
MACHHLTGSIPHPHIHVNVYILHKMRLLTLTLICDIFRYCKN